MSYVAGYPDRPDVSADGRFVVYEDENTEANRVVVKDRQSGEAVVVVNGYDPAVSDDGRYVAYTAEDTNLYRKDAHTGQVVQVDVPADPQDNGPSREAAISGDGRYVAFSSFKRTLVPGDTNGGFDAFVRDMTTGRTERVSVSSGEAQGTGEAYVQMSDITADGRYVLFGGYTAGLVPGDSGVDSDLFVRDRTAGTTARVSLLDDEQRVEAYDGQLSDDGNIVLFNAYYFNGCEDCDDLLVRDRAAGTTRPVDSRARTSDLSRDGVFVAFQSGASELVAGDTNGFFDVFLRDLRDGSTTRVSVANDGTQANDDSGSPALGADGSFVVFASDATNLGGSNPNEGSEVYIRITGM